MVAEGADILDIGAELTRPYGDAVAVSFEEEMRRLEPVLPAVVALGVPVSIDTMKAKVAASALASGAAIVNDVWGLQRDGDLARVVAEHAVPVVIMHNRKAADPAIDIMADIAAFFSRSLDIAARAGIARQHIVLDPGIGFGKTPEQSITAIARLDELKSFGLPLLLGASRKRFIDKVSPAPPDRRLGGSIAAHLLAVAAVPPSSARTTSPRRCRRCGSPRRSGAPDERGRICHRACAPCLSWRDAARSQGRTDLPARPCARHRSRRGVALRQARAHRGLRPGRRCREPGVLRAAAIGSSRPRPARSPRPCSIGFIGSCACG